MRAVYQEKYGTVHDLTVREMPDPRPEKGQVLVRVKASCVHPDVWHVVTGQPGILRWMGAGYSRPRCPIPGIDMAGVVVGRGESARRFSEGDAVFGETIPAMQWVNGGAWAELVCVNEEQLARKPSAMSFEEAAGIPAAGYIAWMNLGCGRLVGDGASVLVNGAAGGVGMLAAQICQALGAEVTVVDHREKRAFLSALGLKDFIDFTTTDFTATGRQYDLVFDVPGNFSYRKCLQAVKEKGKYVLIGHQQFGHTGSGYFGLIPFMIGLSLRGLWNPRLRASLQMPPKPAVMAKLADFAAEGKLRAPVARVFSLEEAGRALDYLRAPEAPGKVILGIPVSPRHGQL
ncbi:MAG: NAD(P)-dependent alcohol dehydrogenase [Spirochaetales bacterium]|nr:NAD(P)-dependent alcohol dehydrogenase [Spirochaetales bacterium]